MNHRTFLTWIASLSVAFTFVKTSPVEASSTPGTITLDGRLYDSTVLTDPLLNPSVQFKVQILSKDLSCVLYEETQTWPTDTSDGYFNLKVGSPLADAKRSGDDPGNVFAAVFQNSKDLLGGGAGCTSPHSPASGDERYVRITVTPSGHSAEVMDPILLDSVPNAMVAESVQGLGPSDLLQAKDDASTDLTQATLESIFSSTNLPLLNALLAGTSTQYMAKSTAAGAALPVYSGNPSTSTAGSIWYDSATNTIKYNNGTVTPQTLGTAGAGLSSVSVTSDLTADGVAGDTLSGPGTIGLANSGVSAGEYTKVTVDAKGRVTVGDVLDNADIPANLSVTSVSATTGNLRTLRLTNATNQYLDIVPPTSITGTPVFTWPGTAGSANQVLQTNGSGTLGWTFLSMADIRSTVTPGNTIFPVTPCAANKSLHWSVLTDTFDCQDIDDLDGAMITTGTIDAARLPNTVALVGGNTVTATMDVGTNAAYNLNLETDSTPRLTVTSTGTVGIGTTAPVAELEVMGTTQSTNLRAVRYDASNTTAPAITFRKAKGDATTPADVTADILGRFDFVAYRNGAFQSTAGAQPSVRIEARSENAVSGDSVPTYLSFSTTGTGEIVHSERMRITGAGRIGVGTTSPFTKMEVAGSLKIGDGGETCGANYVGTLRYSSSQVEFCNGTSWIGLSGTGSTVGAGAGSAGSPSFTFSGDTDSGFYSSAADQIGVAAGGAQIFNISSSGLVSPTTGGGSVSTANGTAGAPTFSFAGDTDTGWFRPAADNLAASTAGSERVRISDTGTVGIGTTSPTSTLHLGSGSTFRVDMPGSSPDGSVVDIGSPQGDPGVNIRRGDGAGAEAKTWQLRVGSDNAFKIQEKTVGASTGSSRFHILTGGNIGIGTTAPETKLNISSTGTSTTLGQYDTNLRLTSDTATANAGNEISFRGKIAATTATATYAAISAPLTASDGTGSVGGILFSTKAAQTDTSLTERMRINSNGNIGIGTTSSSFPLHIASESGYAFRVERYQSGTTGSGMSIGRARGTQAVPETLNAGDQIGSILFDAYEPTTGFSGGSAGNADARIMATVEAGSTPAVGNMPTFMTFATKPAASATVVERMRITSNGFIGMGTTGPVDLLHLQNPTGANALQYPMRLQNYDSTNNAATGVGLAFKAAAHGGADEYFKGAIGFQRTGNGGVGNLHFMIDNVNDATNADLADAKLSILGNGNIGVGTTAPTAALELKAGTATANTAPLKFTSGTVLTTPENGAMEFDGTDFYLTAGGTRRAIASSSSGTMTSVSTISNASGGITLSPSAGNSVQVTGGTTSTSSTSGALIVTGGAGISENLNVGGNITANGNISAATSTAATVGANANSPSIYLTANYWTGAASAIDRWSITNILGTGANPTSTLTFDHPTGTSGSKQYAFLNGNVGIGTTAPSKALEVQGSGDMLVSFRRVDDDNTRADILQLRRTRSSSTAPSSGFGSNIVFRAEGFTNGNDATQARIGAAWENNQTNDTTDRDASLLFLTAADDTITERMRITSAGTVGIGTTSPGAALDVTSGASVIGARISHNHASTAEDGSALTVTNAVIKSLGFHYSAGSENYTFGKIAMLNYNNAGTGWAASSGRYSAGMGFSVSNGGVLSEAIRITNTGNVGIGTTLPTYPLEVRGATFSATYPFNIIATDNATFAQNVGGGIGFQGQFNAAGSVASFGGIRGGKATATDGEYGGFLSLHTRPNGGAMAERMRIDSAGKVGIGTVSPTERFDVRGTTNSSASEVLAKFARPDEAMTFTIQNGVTGANGSTIGTTTGHALALQTAATERMRIDGSGNVGIGTTDPTLGTAYSSSNRILGLSGSADNGNAAGVLTLSNGRATTSAGDTLGTVEFLSLNNGTALNRIGSRIMSVLEGSGGVNGFGAYLAFNTKGDNVAGSWSGNERMRITSAGNIGIGTTAPGSLLGVSKDDATAYDAAAADAQIGVGPTLSLMNPRNTNNNVGGQIVFGMRSTPSYARIGATGGTAPALTFGTNGAERVRIDHTGNVGVGTTSPTYTLHVNGSVAGTGAYNALSDQRLKRDIASVPHALDRLTDLRGVTYDWRRDENPDLKLSHRREMGVIAQEVESVFPEAVSTAKDGIKSVAYSMLIAPLIEAVKELRQWLLTHDREIAQLKAENDELKRKNERLEREMRERFERLEKKMGLPPASN